MQSKDEEIVIRNFAALRATVFPAIYENLRALGGGWISISAPVGARVKSWALFLGKNFHIRTYYVYELYSYTNFLHTNLI